MSVKGRLTLIITGLLVVAVTIAFVVFGLLAWRTMVDEARNDAGTLVSLIARPAGMAEQVPLDVEEALSIELVAQAQGVAIALAVSDQYSHEDLAILLATLVARSPLNAIWVMDGSGEVEHDSLVDVDPFLAEDLGVSSLPAFEPVFAGQLSGAFTEALPSQFGLVRPRFAASKRLDGPGAVIVVQDGRVIADLRESIGLRRLLETTIAAGTVEALWVFNEDREVVQSAAQRSGGERLSPAEQNLVDRTIEDAEVQTALKPNSLIAAAPIFDLDGITSGAVLMRRSVVELRDILTHMLGVGLGLGLLVLAAGALSAYALAGQIARPVRAIAGAARQLEQGAIDHEALARIQKRPDELGQLATTFGGMADVVLRKQDELERLVHARTAELAAKSEALEQAHGQMATELEAAQAMQIAVLPRRFPDLQNGECAALIEPALQMGGDFYDVIPIEGGRVAFVIADVSGKGVPAAFFMAVSRTILVDAVRAAEGPGDALALTNDRLCETNPMDLFVTVFLAVLETATGRVTFANGGHNSPRLVRGDGGGVISLPLTDGIALGVLPGLPFKEAEVRLGPRDLLFLYTDGVTEAMNPSDAQFGDQRLDAVLKKTFTADVQTMLAEVRRAVRDFEGLAPQSDDVTCLAVRYRPPGAGA